MVSYISATLGITTDLNEGDVRRLVALDGSAIGRVVNTSDPIIREESEENVVVRTGTAGSERSGLRSQPP